ncbi:MAG: hypothetical protein WC208_14715 [Gallionella sp.]|jgi:hypothetical protein
MNNISYGQVSSTFSHVLLTAGFLALLQGTTMQNDNFADRNINGLLHSMYVAGDNKPTFNTVGSLVVGSYDLTINELENSVSNFYSRLLASQESLGAEFEKVLYANLWDLYES